MACKTVISLGRFGFGSAVHRSLGSRGDTGPINSVLESGISVEYPSVFRIFSTNDCDDFFCLRVLLLFLTDDVSESDVSLIVSCRLLVLRKIGVGICVVVVCTADGPASFGLGGRGAIATDGLKFNICVWSGLLMKASSCFGFRFGILIFRKRATLLAEEIKDLPEDTTLTSSACFLFLLIFLSPVFFLIKSRLCLLIFCSIVFSDIFFGLLSTYCVSSESRSVFVPNFAISEFRTRTSDDLAP